MKACKILRIQIILLFGLLFLICFRFFNPNKILEDSVTRAVSLTQESEIFDEWRTLSQDDPVLLNFIRSQYLIAPSKKPYNLKEPNEDPSSNEGQNKYVIEILHNMTGGFFVECGAYDGEFLSTTLVLERDYGWTGFMAEPVVANFANLVSKNRKSWIANICLSTINRPQMVTFEEVEENLSNSGIQKFMGTHVQNLKKKVTKVACFPIFSVLLALNVATVDFFTLDVEGAELDVLKTIPFDSILIKIFCIEWNHVPEGKAELRRYVESKNYTLVAEIRKGNAYDLLFAHKSVPLPQKYNV